jgi:hypothetical protein
VGLLHYHWPRPPKASGGYPVRAVALVGVIAGYGNSMRTYSVYEKASQVTPESVVQGFEL